MRFARPTQEDAGLGITPLVDVVLLLLVFFLVTTSFEAPHLALDLPEASEATQRPLVDVLRVVLPSEGGVRLGDAPASFEALEARLRDEPPAGGIELRADGDVSHERVVEVLDAARRHDVHEIAIAVEKRTMP